VFAVDAFALVPLAPGTVFAAAASLEGAVRWQSGVEGVRRPRGRGARIGARTGALVLLYRALGQLHRLDVAVTAFEPPTRFAYRAAGDAFALETTLTLEATSDGTRVHHHVALDLAPDAALDAPALRRLLARRTEGDLARLAAWAGTWSRTMPSNAATAVG
jgi:hypothetical protein